MKTPPSSWASVGLSTIQAAYHLGVTFEEKFGPIWAHRVELVRTRQQPPAGDDWLAGADGDGGEAEADEGDDGED